MQYQDIIKSTLDEYRINNNKKYADKYDTLKNFKFIETQIKTVNENYNKKLDGQDNWLLAKKPLNNYLCASCEGIIRGELDKRCDYIPWNKYPNRDEKYSRMGHGFSHMLQMVNDDIRKNVDNKEKEKDNKERNMKNEDKDNNSVLAILSGLDKEISKIRSETFTDQDFIDLLVKLTGYKPEDRPNFEEIYRNKWLNKDLDRIHEIFWGFEFDEEKLIMELQKNDYIVEKNGK